MRMLVTGGQPASAKQRYGWGCDVRLVEQVNAGVSAQPPAHGAAAEPPTEGGSGRRGDVG